MPMGRVSRIAPAILAGALSLSCISDPPTLPGPGPAFTTNATAYILELSGNARVATISWTYQDESGDVTALQGCTGGVARWTLEKQVGTDWEAVYPVCTPNDAAGIAVVGGGTAAGTIILTDVVDENSAPRISQRPVAGTYRLKFGLFEDINPGAGTGVPVTGDRPYSNTFTLQEG
jgi:hypothetical protein